MQMPEIKIKDKKNNSEAFSSEVKTTAHASVKTAFNWEMYKDRNLALKKLKESNKFVDALLVTSDGGSQLVHTCVLSTLSSKLNEIILTQMQNPKTCLVEVENVNKNLRVKKINLPEMNRFVLKTLVNCAYTGYISSDPEDIWEIIKAAEYFEMNDVIQACCTYLAYQLNVDNCIKLFHFGGKYQHKLQIGAWKMIKANFHTLVEQNPEFISLTQDHLKKLLKDDELNLLNEDLAWLAVTRWIHHNPVDRIVFLKDLLKLLRYGRMSRACLEEKMACDPIIYQNPETYKMVQEMIKQNKLENESQHLDGYGLPVGLTPFHIRPRAPNQVMFAIGGWLEGVPTTLIETYDVRTNKWFESKTLHKFPRAYHGAQELNGIIYLVGGTNGSEILNTVHCYDPSKNKWYQRANMFEQRCYVSTAVVNNFLYVLGGHNGLQRIRTGEKYDHLANQWYKIPEMNLSRSDACATVHNGVIFIAGGLNDQIIENSVEMFNPLDSVWTFIQPMNSPRTSLAFISYKNSLYALGGNNGFERLSSVERYDFKEKAWFQFPPMKSRRSTFSAGVIENEIYVVGGYNGHTPISQVEKFDEICQDWIIVKNLKHDRSGLAVCVMSGLANSKDFTYLGLVNEIPFRNNCIKNAKNLFIRRRILNNTLQNNRRNRLNR